MMTNEQLADWVRRYGRGRTIPIDAQTVQEMADLIAQLWEERQNATIKSDNTQALYNALETIQQQRDAMLMAREEIERIKVPNEMINRALTGIERASKFSNDAVISNTSFIRGFQKQIAEGLDEASKALAALDAALKGGE